MKNKFIEDIGNVLVFYTKEDLQVFKYQVFIILRKLQIAEYFFCVALIVFNYLSPMPTGLVLVM